MKRYSPAHPGDPQQIAAELWEMFCKYTTTPAEIQSIAEIDPNLLAQSIAHLRHTVQEARSWEKYEAQPQLFEPPIQDRFGDIMSDSKIAEVLQDYARQLLEEESDV